MWVHDTNVRTKYDEQYYLDQKKKNNSDITSIFLKSWEMSTHSKNAFDCNVAVAI